MEKNPKTRVTKGTTLLALNNDIGFKLRAELAAMTPSSFLRGKLARMSYSTYWDELLHQESGGVPSSTICRLHSRRVCPTLTIIM